MNECKKCGKCCCVNELRTHINVIILQDDLVSISKFLKIDKKEFVGCYCVCKSINLGSNQNHNIYLLKALNGKCIFLENSLCKIHNVKPLQCKLAPYHLFSTSNLWNHLPCYSKKENKYAVTESDINFVKKILEGYSL